MTWPGASSCRGCSTSPGRGCSPSAASSATALDELDDEDYRDLARKACDEFARGEVTDEDWLRFRRCLRYVPGSEGAAGLARAVADRRGASSTARRAGCTT